MHASLLRTYWKLFISVVGVGLYFGGHSRKVAKFPEYTFEFGVEAWTLHQRLDLRSIPAMSRLHLQFQAGEPEPNEQEWDDNVNVTIPESVATSFNIVPALERPVYASISSKKSALSSSINESNNTKLTADTSSEVNQFYEQWYTYILDLQKIYGSDAVALVSEQDCLDDDDYEYASVIINSLIFSVVDPLDESHSHSAIGNTNFFVVVIEANRRVNISALQSVLVSHEILSPDVAARVLLAPSNQVQTLCGFAPGCVPPIFSQVVGEDFCPPLVSIVDESLLQSLPLEDILLYGGGGEHFQSLRIAMDVLLQQPRTIVATVAHSKDIKGSPSCDEASSSRITPALDASESRLRSGLLPYFAIAGPSDAMEVQKFRLQVNATESLVSSDGAEPQNFISRHEEVVSFVGRVGSVRRMARTLSFCDLIPPNEIVYDEEEMSNLGVLYPWRNPLSGSAMAVQLILGQTLLQATGSDDVIRQIHPGQLVFVQGRTNFQSVNSIRNWIKNQTLDIVVQSYQQLLVAPSLDQKSIATQKKSAQRKPTSVRAPITTPSSVEHNRNCLRLKDLFTARDADTLQGDFSGVSELPSNLHVNGEFDVGGNFGTASIPSNVVVVSDVLTVKQFTSDLSQLLRGSGQSSNFCLVGIDCEWQPTFLLPSTRDPQPVLLLQVSLHALERVYLFDLHTLLRPMMPASQSMGRLERDVSVALGALFESKRLVKVGFHVVNDLRQLAASYPHISSFQFYNAVLEASTLGKKEIRHTQSGNAREATSSLSRLVAHYLGKPLNKSEQCSDWAKRPLSVSQIEYSALDAAVTPMMVEMMMSSLDIRFFGEKPCLGRWENDTSFKNSISSLRFVFVQTYDPTIQRKLKAKRVVGDPLVVSQSWTTGDVPPKLPVLPETGSDGVYTDINGFVQIPSVSVIIRSVHLDDVIDSMIGRYVGTSKDVCLGNFLGRQDLFSNGAKLEYPQRSGFVEFNDGVVLFVNMQGSQGNRFKSKSYPNEWLNNGQVLTWFLRENDWQRGETRLAKKLLSSPNSITVTLFVRFGRTGEFICCGRCQVEECLEVRSINGVIEDDLSTENWTLVKLHLMLLDWKKLQSSAIFQAMLNIPESEGHSFGEVRYKEC